MAGHHKKADAVIAVNAVLAALALVLLGWQITQSLQRLRLPEAMACPFPGDWPS